MNQADNIILEVESKTGDIVVAKNEHGNYDVSHNGVIRHPDCTPEGAMRALATYLQTALFKLENQ